MNWGWVAGMLEGEGHFELGRRARVHKTKNPSPCSCTKISITVHSTDQDVLEMLHAATGMGNLYGPYRKVSPVTGLETKPMYE